MNGDLELLARAGWPAVAQTEVVAVSVVGDRAEVSLLVDGYEYWMYFARDAGGRWNETASSNGPTDGWDDPTRIDWGHGSE